MLQALLLIVGLVELLSAVLLLVVVIQLLRLQVCHHAVNHGCDLLEANLLSMEGESNQVKTHAIEADRFINFPELLQGTSTLQAVCDADLNEAGRRAGKGLLEQLQGVVIIEHLDGFCKGSEFIRARLHPLFPFCLLSGAALFQVCEETLVDKQCLLRVPKVVFHLLDGDTQLPNFCHLGLDGGGECEDLLLFGAHQGLVCLDGRGLRGRSIREACAHLVTQRFQDPGDLTALRGVAGILASCEERQHCLPIVVLKRAGLRQKQLLQGQC
mmetsp:Transcript_70750/g.160708  ORF Transcript_70750/g.160708 Transcript_70750/m.160708 type:complete len:270 (-) Transcript_70750:560-1369(-)